MKVAVHLGHIKHENLVTCRNTNVEELKTLFDITEILGQNREILNVSTIEWQFIPWIRSTLLHDKQSSGRKPKYTSSQIQFFVWERWRSIRKPLNSTKISFKMSDNGFRTLFGIDGEPIEFEWNISQGSQHCRFSNRSKTRWKLVKHVPKNLKIESSSFDDIAWTEKGHAT